MTTQKIPSPTPPSPPLAQSKEALDTGEYEVPKPCRVKQRERAEVRRRRQIRTSQQRRR